MDLILVSLEQTLEVSFGKHFKIRNSRSVEQYSFCFTVDFRLIILQYFWFSNIYICWIFRFEMVKVIEQMIEST